MAGLRGHAPVSIHTFSLSLSLPIHSVPPLLLLEFLDVSWP